MGAWFEEIPGEKSASGGKVYEIREDPQPTRFDVYNRFAHEIFDEPIPLKNPREFANMVRANWVAHHEFHQELSLLRVCLLIEVRRGRFIWGYPGPDDMEYMDALYAHIQSLMA
jgi:hypothetical protein